jgi:hypothetical protein
MNSFTIRTLEVEKHLYISIRSSNFDRLTLIINKLNEKLEEHKIDLTQNNKEIFFSDMGKELLLRIEQQYECKFVVKHILK